VRRERKERERKRERERERERFAERLGIEVGTSHIPCGHLHVS
jgi:hypothetical protein